MKVFSRLKKHRYNEENINIKELNEMMKTKPKILLLDVRSPQEYREGHLNRSN